MSDVRVPCIPWYEAMWFVDHDGVIEDCFTEDFKTEEELLSFYELHKNDKEKYGWKITKRGYGFRVLKNYLKRRSA